MLSVGKVKLEIFKVPFKPLIWFLMSVAIALFWALRSEVVGLAKPVMLMVPTLSLANANLIPLTVPALKSASVIVVGSIAASWLARSATG